MSSTEAFLRAEERKRPPRFFLMAVIYVGDAHFPLAFERSAGAENWANRVSAMAARFFCMVARRFCVAGAWLVPVLVGARRQKMMHRRGHPPTVSFWHPN
jgi:hypothetical protein